MTEAPTPSSDQPDKVGGDCPQWLQPFFAELDALPEPEWTPSLLKIESMPDWALKALLALCGQACPTVDLFGLHSRNSIKDFGRFLGQRCTNLSNIEALIPCSPRPEETAQIQELLETIDANQHLVPFALASKLFVFGEGVTSGPDVDPEWFQDFTARCCTAAITQADPSDRLTYFKAFAAGLAKPSFRGLELAAATTALPIYARIFLGWETIRNLKSIQELRIYLLESGLLEQQLGRDPKRLEKICQRIGLRLGKPGRPRKMQNSDTAGA